LYREAGHFCRTTGRKRRGAADFCRGSGLKSRATGLKRRGAGLKRRAAGLERRAAGLKRGVDQTLVAGSDSVQYTVQGQRADSSGPVSPIFTVNFGRLREGGFTAAVVHGFAVSTPETRAAGSLPASTVNGQVVQKVRPGVNGNARTGARA
jgi:hypothetical protein